MKIPIEKEKKGLILFFSSTGRTQSPMLKLMEELDGERIIPLRPCKAYTGPFGVLRALRETANQNRESALEPITEPLDAARYDFAVIGTPVWGGKAAAPIRTFLRQNNLSHIGKVAYVITHGGSTEYTAVLDELDALTGQKRVAALSLDRQSLENKEKLAAFIKELKEKFAL